MSELGSRKAKKLGMAIDEDWLCDNGERDLGEDGTECNSVVLSNDNGEDKMKGSKIVIKVEDVILGRGMERVVLDKKDAIPVDDLLFKRDGSSAIIDRIQVSLDKSYKLRHIEMVNHYRECIMDVIGKKIDSSYISALRQYLNHIDGRFF